MGGKKCESFEIKTSQKLLIIVKSISMKKQLTFFLFQLLFWNTAITQNDTYELELNKAELGVIGAPNIIIDSIVDGRVNKNYWGVVLGTLRTPVTYSKGTLGLKEYLNASISSKSSTSHLIMILKNFWINEQTVGMKEIATCDLEIILCKKDQNNQWRVVLEFEDQVEGSSAIADMTRSTPKRVKEIFEKALSSIDTTKLTSNNGEIYQEKPLILSNCIAFKKDSLVYGFYKNFNYFYNNKAQKLDINIKKSEFSDERFKLVDAKTGEKIERFFGFFDGESLYLNSSSYGQVNSHYYSKVLTFGRYMLVDDIYIDPMAAGSQFGLIGAIAVASSATRGMMLDTYTGQSIVISKKVLIELLTPYPELLKKFKKLSYDHDTFEIHKLFIDALNKIELEKK
jgi:hypothetical protein